ncbi:MAG: DUF1993 family protein [Burkholderiaceae bacterium]|jgi:hypothetical protein
MSLSMYQASIPVFAHALTSLSDLLSKAEAHASVKKIEPGVLLNARLYPDMFALVRQVQIACDVVKGGAARLAGVELPSFPDTETTFAELQARVRKTIDYVKSISAEHIDGSESRSISLKVGPNDLRFDGQSYLLKFVLPNLYFHTTTVYAILRHNGVEIGKKDYLGSIQD